MRKQKSSEQKLNTPQSTNNNNNSSPSCHSRPFTPHSAISTSSAVVSKVESFDRSR